jgi:hypothetical protein
MRSIDLSDDASVTLYFDQLVSFRARPEQFGLFRSILYRYQAGISSCSIKNRISHYPIRFILALFPHLYVSPFKIALLLPLPWLGDHSRVAIWTWWTSWRCMPIYEVSSFRVPRPHASRPYSRCRP